MKMTESKPQWIAHWLMVDTKKTKGNNEKIKEKKLASRSDKMWTLQPSIHGFSPFRNIAGV